MTYRCVTIALSVLAFGLAAGPLAAQPMGPGGGPPMGPGGGPPTFFENLFPPNLIMRNDSEIGLTEEQRKAIMTLMADAQKTLVPLQWDVERESQKLSKMLEGAHVDEGPALEQANRVMTAEQHLKEAHLALLIRIKNELTSVQQQKLRQARPERRGGPPQPE